MPEPLSLEQVRHVARLARLRLSEAEMEKYRTQLSAVLDHIAMLSKLNLDDIEPMAHPLELRNRLDEDQIGPALPVEALMKNAPAREGCYLAVPKVIGEEGGSA